jgi:four helix bundle protein
MSEWARTFEDLEVFQRAYRLSLEVHQASLALPRIEQFALADQLRRASKSICANIAEGFGKQRQSRSDEMPVWTLYCRDLGYIGAETAERWRGEYQDIARMLQGLSRRSSDP